MLASLDAANIPLIEFLVRDIQTLEPHERIERWFRLLRFCYPRLKSIELIPPGPVPQPQKKSDPPPAHSLSTEELVRLARNPTEPKANA